MYAAERFFHPFLHVISLLKVAKEKGNVCQGGIFGKENAFWTQLIMCPARTKVKTVKKKNIDYKVKTRILFILKTK